MSKYDPIAYLLHLRDARGYTSVTLTFVELETVLGFPLPASTRRHREWWGNDLSHSQAVVWMGAGWKVGHLSMTGEVVRFDKSAA